MAGAPRCEADSVSADFCLLHCTSAKLGGQGGGRISLRLLQAKIEHDLFSSTAINTFLSNNPSYSSYLGAQESQVMSDAQTKANWRKIAQKYSFLAFLHSATLLKHHMAPSCSTCRALHILCTCFAMMEFSPYLGEATLYFSVVPYGVIKMNRKGYTQKSHKLRNTCLLQVWRTADSKGLLRIEKGRCHLPRRTVADLPFECPNIYM